VNHPRRRRLFRFSLRTLLVVLTALCLLLGYKVRHVQQQQAAVAWVQQMHGVVTYDFEVNGSGAPVPYAQPPGPNWLRQLIGVDYFASVVGVNLTNPLVNDVTPLATLLSLKELCVQNTAVSDLSPLAKLTRLERLRLISTPVTDVSMVPTLTKLRALRLGYCRITSLSALTRVRELKKLELHEVPVEDREIAELHKALPACDIIDYSR
jgi:hypothetical protein